MQSLYKWRIGLSSATLVPLPVANIPTPSLVNYQGHSARTNRGEGGTSKHGYRKAEILWQRLTNTQARNIFEYISDAGAGQLYFTIPVLDGSRTQNNWMDISGYPNLGDIAPIAPMVFVGSHLHDNVLLTLNNVSIVEANPVF